MVYCWTSSCILIFCWLLLSRLDLRVFPGLIISHSYLALSLIAGYYSKSLNYGAVVIIVLLPIILTSTTAMYGDQYADLLSPDDVTLTTGDDDDVMTSSNLVTIILTVTLLVFAMAWIPLLLLVWKHRTMSPAEQISFYYIR